MKKISNFIIHKAFKKGLYIKGLEKPVEALGVSCDRTIIVVNDKRFLNKKMVNRFLTKSNYKLTWSTKPF